MSLEILRIRSAKSKLTRGFEGCQEKGGRDELGPARSGRCVVRSRAWYGTEIICRTIVSSMRELRGRTNFLRGAEGLAVRLAGPQPTKPGLRAAVAQHCTCGLFRDAALAYSDLWSELGPGRSCRPSATIRKEYANQSCLFTMRLARGRMQM